MGKHNVAIIITELPQYRYADDIYLSIQSHMLRSYAHDTESSQMTVSYNKIIIIFPYRFRFDQI